MMKTTIKEIAKSLNVAPVTVYRAIYNRPRISKTTKDIILERVKKLGYKPNILGKSLRLKKSFLVGVIVPDLTLSFYPEIVEGIEDVLDEVGYSIVLRTPGRERDKLEKSIEILIEKHIDGLIISYPHFPKNLYNRLIREKIPLHFISHKHKGINGPYVVVDNLLGGYLATEHLIKLGFKNIFYVSRASEEIIFVERFRGYKKALKKYHLKYNKENVAKTNTEIMEILKNAPKPLAIFCSTDLDAVRIIGTSHNMGLNPFKDLAIVGFDDIPVASVVNPSLTTIAQPKREMGKRGAANLLKIMNGEKIENVYLKPYLVVRESTKRGGGDVKTANGKNKGRTKTEVKKMRGKGFTLIELLVVVYCDKKS